MRADPGFLDGGVTPGEMLTYILITCIRRLQEGNVSQFIGFRERFLSPICNATWVHCPRKPSTRRYTTSIPLSGEEGWGSLPSLWMQS